VITGKNVDIKFSVHHVSAITFIRSLKVKGQKNQLIENNEDIILKTEGQNFHQYQQNEQTSLTLTH
jgi:hypothetical protein